MASETSIATLLHILVLVYWLGGDLGAFHSSGFFVDHERPLGERLLALKILGGVDMAPRTALILALPTGLLLARSKGWLAAFPGAEGMLAVIWLASLLWLALAWKVHLAHGPAAESWRKRDLAFRYSVLAALLWTGFAGMAGLIALPLFMAAKLLVLAACIGLGLWVRRVLRPLGHLVASLLAQGSSSETEAQVSAAIAKARIPVIGIWALILLAAWLGLTTPL